MSKQNKGLGKGLDALFSNEMTDIDFNNENSISKLKIFEIKPNKNQPRKEFDSNLLVDLADSIKEHGVLQPILVRPDKIGGFEIVAGERRWRASKIAGLSEVPVIIKELDDIEMMEIALIENLQRTDLNAIEEALGYKFLIQNYNMSQEVIAKRVGKSRSAIANVLRLLSLPQKVIDLIKNNKISAGHARALVTLENSDEIINKANEIIEKKLSVRDIENLIKIKKNNKQIRSIIPNKIEDKPVLQYEHDKSNNEFYNFIQKNIMASLKRNVNVNLKEKKLEIEFFDKQDLAEILEKMIRTLK